MARNTEDVQYEYGRVSKISFISFLSMGVALIRTLALTIALALNPSDTIYIHLNQNQMLASIVAP